MSEQLYTIDETGKLLRVSRSTVYALLREGELQGVVVGQRQRVPLSSIDALIARGIEKARRDGGQ